MRSLYIAVPLFALLAAALWYAVTAWERFANYPVPFYGWLAIGGGVFASLLVGGGLMALVFYSSRRGYDDLADKGSRHVYDDNDDLDEDKTR